MRATVERREFVRAGSIGILAGIGAGGLCPAVAAQADAGAFRGTAKVAARPMASASWWFEDAETMKKAMASPEMGAVVEDAKRFLDMGRAYALVADEKVVID